MHPLVVHCKRSEYDIYIGRGRDPRSNDKYGSIWGNPFTHLHESSAPVKVESRDLAVQLHRTWLLTGWKIESLPYSDQVKLSSLESRRRAVIYRLPELRGKRLGCWCAPQSCHGNNLVEFASLDIEQNSDEWYLFFNIPCDLNREPEPEIKVTLEDLFK